MIYVDEVDAYSFDLYQDLTAFLPWVLARQCSSKYFTPTVLFDANSFHVEDPGSQHNFTDILAVL